MIDETTAIAQLVERTAFNRVVEGSSPSGGVDEDSWMKTKSTLQQSLSEADPQSVCVMVDVSEYAREVQGGSFKHYCVRTRGFEPHCSHINLLYSNDYTSRLLS